MENILLKISYDGTNYSGWQRQKNSTTVQGTIENVIKKIVSEEINLIASGRTDAGVHAISQVANFNTNSNIPSNRFSYAINSKLPKDITILSSKSVEMDFNSRFCAKNKTYIYKIYNDLFQTPFYKNYSLHIEKELDLELMKQNAKMLIGSHDFTSFYTKEKGVYKDPIKTIYNASISKEDKIINFEITGNGFLYNMVRIITGTLIEIGLHKKQNSIEEILELKDRKFAGETSKPEGLFLKEVIY